MRKSSSTNAPKSSKSPVGSASGWKRRMPFSIGWMSASNRRTCRQNFRTQNRKDELAGQAEPGELLQRVGRETLGCRARGPVQGGDAALEKELSRRGLDAYQPEYARYTFCAVCEPEDGWVTLLSETLWPTEIIRRIRPAAQKFNVYIARPH